MESLYLKTFIEVVKTGNLTKAADNLHVTPSAVSRRIKFMEEQYGYELLDRSGQKIIPTDVGSLVLEKAQQLLRIERELYTGLTNIRKPSKISFGCTPAFGIAFLPNVLHSFMLMNSKMNNLEFHFDMPDNLVSGLNENVFDLALIEHCDCLDLSGFTTFPLPEDEMFFVYSPKLFAGRNDVNIKMLTSHTIYTRKKGCCSRTLLESNMEKIGRSVNDFRKMIVFDDYHIIIDSVIQGLGIAYISDCLVSDKIADGYLVGHHVEGFKRHKKRTLVLSETAKQQNVTVNFAKEILNYFGLSRDLSELVGKAG
ncbi:MAG: multiheme cytochrome-associated LysR family transcriptional regulator [Geobacteraceae bacterium]